jgi:hypothetical protein
MGENEAAVEMLAVAGKRASCSIQLSYGRKGAAARWTRNCFVFRLSSGSRQANVPGAGTFGGGMRNGNAFWIGRQGARSRH